VSPHTLGAIIAGGASSRFGTPKALAEVDGRRIIDRVASTLAAAVPTSVLIANDPVIADALPLESRPDVVTGAGALGGVLTAALWAQETSFDWVLAVACDMPFIETALLELLVVRTAEARTADLIVPASNGPRGVEPLCAAYRTTCIAPIRASIERGDTRMIGFHREIRVSTIPLDEVIAIGDPASLFMNVNTRDDLDRASRMIGRVR